MQQLACKELNEPRQLSFCLVRIGLSCPMGSLVGTCGAMMPSCGFVSLACRAMVYANCLVSFMPFMALMAFIAFMCFMSCPMVGSYYTMTLCQDIAVHKPYSYYRT